MKTEEAILHLELRKFDEDFFDYMLEPAITSFREHNKKNDDIIELLQRGEEYKRILQHIGVISDNEQVNRIIRDTLLGG